MGVHRPKSRPSSLNDLWAARTREIAPCYLHKSGELHENAILIGQEDMRRAYKLRSKAFHKGKPKSAKPEPEPIKVADPKPPEIVHSRTTWEKPKAKQVKRYKSWSKS